MSPPPTLPSKPCLCHTPTTPTPSPISPPPGHRLARYVVINFALWRLRWHRMAAENDVWPIKISSRERERERWREKERERESVSVVTVDCRLSLLPDLSPSTLLSLHYDAIFSLVQSALLYPTSRHLRVLLLLMCAILFDFASRHCSPEIENHFEYH